MVRSTILLRRFIALATNEATYCQALLVNLFMGAQPIHAQNISPHAKPIARTSTWYLQHGVTYHWLSQSKILFVRNSRWSPMNAHSTPVQLGIPIGGTVQYLDLKRKREVALPAVTRNFDATNGFASSIQLSPGGQYVYWTAGFGGDVWLNALSATKAKKLPLPGELVSARGRLYAVCVEYNPMYLTAAEVTKIAAIPKVKKYDLDWPFPIKETPVRIVNRDLTLFTTSWDPRQHQDINNRPESVEVITLNIPANTETLRRYPIHFPAGQRLAAMKFAPSGRRIVWLLQSRSGETTLWMSSFKGLRWRHFDGIELNTDADFITNLQWTPDGTRISFVRNDILYTISTF